jgi:predicted esterase
MLEKVLEKFQSKRLDFKEILFTGHSAGGAVAALVFAHLKLTKKLGDVPDELIWCRFIDIQR